MTVNPIPNGYTTLTPFLCVENAARALEFYTSVFGATLIEKVEMADGPRTRVAHAELDFGNGRLQLADPQDAYQLAAPDPTGFATHSTALYCSDVDAVVERAAQSGATIREPAQTFVTGDRFASILDPFGHRWAVMTRVEDVSPGERDRRLTEWSKDHTP
jgi:PhnB protein